MKFWKFWKRPGRKLIKTKKRQIDFQRWLKCYLFGILLVAL